MTNYAQNRGSEMPLQNHDDHTYIYIHTYTHTLLMFPKWAFQLNRIKNTNLYKLIKNVSTITL